MKKSLSLLICLMLIASSALCGCGSNPEDEQPTTEPQTEVTTAEPTTVAPTTAPVPATKDSAETAGYDYVAIKKNSGDIISKFDKTIETNKFSGSIYMKLGNDFEYLSSTGDANANKHLDNSINTRFYVGDITKQFTAAAVLLLAEQNKLSLDDTIDKYFPDYEHGEKITVKQLLNMTAGIKTYVNHNEIANPSNIINSDLSDLLKEDNSAEENREIIRDWIFDQELCFEPGTRFNSSESNYYLLGEIIAQASGGSYSEYLESAVFKPLGMGSSGFEPDEKMAVAYDNSPATQNLNFAGVGYSAYGMISNVSDLLKWTDGLLNNQVLTSESFGQMFKNQLSGLKDNKKAYGYGVELNGKCASALSRYDAFSSILSYDTDKSEIYIGLTNNSSSDNNLVRSSFKKILQKYAV